MINYYFFFYCEKQKQLKVSCMRAYYCLDRLIEPVSNLCAGFPLLSHMCKIGMW
jgi:hypothetical protein